MPAIPSNRRGQAVMRPEPTVPPTVSRIRRGGKAAQEAYSCLDIRQSIFAFLDRATLAGALRLSRKSTASVAEILYHRVGVSVMASMGRGTERRRVYCDAVRILDRNTPPPFEPLLAEYGPRHAEFQRAPVRFDLKRLSSDLVIWLRKFPNLRTIYADLPANAADDAYVVYINEVRGAEANSVLSIRVELESKVQVEMYDYPLPIPNASLLPPLPTSDLMAISQTIAIQLLANTKRMCPIRLDQLQMSAHFSRWKTWLYLDPALDARVSSIDHYVVGEEMRVSVDDSLSFLAERRQRGCAPITRFTLCHTPNAFLATDGPPMTAERLRAIAAAIGPQLQELRISMSAVWSSPAMKDLQIPIGIFDNAFPSLRKLFLGFEYNSTSLKPTASLHGMPALQVFHMENKFRFPEPDITRMPEMVYGLGADECTFYCHGLITVLEMKAMNESVQTLRKQRREQSLPITRDEPQDRREPSLPVSRNMPQGRHASSPGTDPSDWFEITQAPPKTRNVAPNRQASSSADDKSDWFEIKQSPPKPRNGPQRQVSTSARKQSDWFEIV